MDDATAAIPPLEAFVAEFRAAVADGRFVRIVLAKPRSPAGSDLRKVAARPLLLKERPVVSFVQTHATRDVTTHLPPDEAAEAVRAWLADGVFAHAHLFTSHGTLEWRTGKRGRQALLRGKGAPTAAPASPATHDRAKVRHVALDRPYLVALGVTDAEHRLIPSMARKWKQIDKFVEILDHAIAAAGLPDAARPIEVLDFGSGKGYLTFATHDHLRHTLGVASRVTGVELRRDMVDLCNAAAASIGADGLVFEEGDVGRRAPQPVDVMIALHACDTATDHAIHAGVRAGAAVIVCAPCCHKELRPQLLRPHPLAPVLRHGVHLGQHAEMLTDGLRAMVLEACGYETQVFEFVSLEHTAKNKMILAVRRGGPLPTGAADAWQEIDVLKQAYGIRTQCLETLLRGEGRAAAGCVAPTGSAEAGDCGAARRSDAAVDVAQDVRTGEAARPAARGDRADRLAPADPAAALSRS